MTAARRVPVSRGFPQRRRTLPWTGRRVTAALQAPPPAAAPAPTAAAGIALAACALPRGTPRAPLTAGRALAARAASGGTAPSTSSASSPPTHARDTTRDTRSIAAGPTRPGAHPGTVAGGWPSATFPPNSSRRSDDQGQYQLRRSVALTLAAAKAVPGGAERQRAE